MGLEGAVRQGGAEFGDAGGRPVCYGACMLDLHEIGELARDAGRQWFGARSIKDVLTEDSTDLDGNDAVTVTFVIGPRSARRVTGEDILRLHVDLRRRLADRGETRYSRIRYATPADLAADADSEP